MYKNNFVVSIIKDGSPVKEFNGKIYLPFNSEYSIRLKNKHDRRAIANVFIDGKSANSLGGIIIPANKSITLERFLDHSLSEGQRFKFVSLDHPEVDDPTDSNNGIIKVEFQLEKIQPIYWIESTDFKKIQFPKWEIDSVIWDYTSTTTTDKVERCINPTNYYSHVILDSHSDLEGATIGGGKSNQEFGWGEYFSTEIDKTIITLKIYSNDDQNKVSKSETYVKKYCTRCGRRKRVGDNFCGSCGNKY